MFGSKLQVVGKQTNAVMVHMAQDAYAVMAHVAQPACVNCGKRTGNFCDSREEECFASDRLGGAWPCGWRTPLCTFCERKHEFCFFCLGISWARPQEHD